MAFCTFTKDYVSNSKTVIDNSIITSYLSDADEKAVKVYLYGLFICQNGIDSFSVEDMASSLGYTISEIENAFKFWEELGVINVYYEPYSVEFLPVGESGNKYKKYKPEKYQEFNKDIQALISGRMITTNEYLEYFNLMENSGLKQDALKEIVKYSVTSKGDSISYRYISAIAKDMISKNKLTLEQVSKELSFVVTVGDDLTEILLMLGVKRTPEFEEVQLYKKWTENLLFETSIIIFTIKTFKIKSIRKLDAILDELYSNKCFDEESIKLYQKDKSKITDLTYEINKILGLYYESVDMIIKTYVAPWISMGFDGETLKFTANYCFRHNIRNYDGLEEIILKFRKEGLTTLDSITQFITQKHKDDSFIKEILSTLCINRRPNNWDRDNLQVWRGWNFSDEMIMEAVKLSINKNNPIVYVNGILSNWKARGIYSVEQISQGLPKQEKKFENERTYTESELNDMVDSLDDIRKIL